MHCRSSDKKDPPESKAANRPNGLHLPLQKKASNETSPSSMPRSRSSSTTSNASEISSKSTTSTPSAEVPKEFRIEPDRKDTTDNEGKRRKSKEHGSTESISHCEEKPKIEVQRKNRKSEKEARHRKGNIDAHERRPYEEVPASNIVIKEVSILDEENDKAVLGKQRKKFRSGPKKEPKEQKKQQPQPQPQPQSQPQQQPVTMKEVKPVLDLGNSNLADQLTHSDSTFTKVESRAHKLLRKGNKVEPAPVVSPSSHSDSLDRLDEISISGPRPDGRDLIKLNRIESLSKAKSDNGKRIEIPPRKKSQQNASQTTQQQGTKVFSRLSNY